MIPVPRSAEEAPHTISIRGGRRDLEGGEQNIPM